MSTTARPLPHHDVLTAVAPFVLVGLVLALAAGRVLDALALMTKRRIRHLPVTDDGRMCGFISIGDLVKARLDEIEHEAEALREYIQTA